MIILSVIAIVLNFISLVFIITEFVFGLRGFKTDPELVYIVMFPTCIVNIMALEILYFRRKALEKQQRIEALKDKQPEEN